MPWMVQVLAAGKGKENAEVRGLKLPQSSHSLRMLHWLLPLLSFHSMHSVRGQLWAKIRTSKESSPLDHAMEEVDTTNRATRSMLGVMSTLGW